MRVSRAEVGDKGSVGLRVLDLRGLPAKAWDWRFMDMVVVEAMKNGRVLVKVGLIESFLEREQRRVVVGDEKRRESIC